ncbi:hypothetical protein EB06_01732 [Enterococcus cecorum]|nr:hypothetical protein EB06_01732 [Enterococcus cecorum]
MSKPVFYFEGANEVGNNDIIRTAFHLPGNKCLN